ncbi:MAG TPA: heme exporter protein CcmD [Gammaproteobacteria bacterium]|nr:heme exporter protein CcmD [Gammaproteobacteria bacterium]
MTLHEFIHMGGYAFYVWTSFGVAAAVMVLNLAMPALRMRRLRRDLRRAAYMREADYDA